MHIALKQLLLYNNKQELKISIVNGGTGQMLKAVIFDMDGLIPKDCFSGSGVRRLSFTVIQ